MMHRFQFSNSDPEDPRHVDDQTDAGCFCYLREGGGQVVIITGSTEEVAACIARLTHAMMVKDDSFLDALDRHVTLLIERTEEVTASMDYSYGKARDVH